MAGRTGPTIFGLPWSSRRLTAGCSFVSGSLAGKVGVFGGVLCVCILWVSSDAAGSEKFFSLLSFLPVMVLKCERANCHSLLWAVLQLRW